MILFFEWLFLESTARVFWTWVFFLKFGLRLFSVPLLLRTFFSPWHRYWYGYPKNIDPVEIFYAFFGNIMSRGIGVILRTFVIVLGLLFELFVCVMGIIFLVFWFMLPFVSVYFFYLGFTLAF